MKRLFFGALVCALLSAAAWAALKDGDTAPDFTLPAAVGGKSFVFKLSEALKKGPVVVYFYPKSFTRICTEEAYAFAESAENFAAAGAKLIGVSADTIETQIEFSSKECRDKFPVAADPNLVAIRAYDAVRAKPGPNGATIADRISYVVAPDGKIIYAYRDPEARKHIENTLATVRHWREEHKN
ncbi:MAG: peroxiredoxin [Rhodoblastus sp.]|uniref:peroxiredoxin n=1 Tax=Rhodoblastus sp. TaxID=1962975 RepID=UPI003F966E32